MKELFDHSGGSKFHIFKNTSNIQITEKPLRPRDIPGHSKNIGKDIYLVSAQGLNVSPGNFFHHWIKPNDIGFGFDPFDDKLMNEYYEKATSALLSLGYKLDSFDSTANSSLAITILNRYKNTSGHFPSWVGLKNSGSRGTEDNNVMEELKSIAEEFKKNNKLQNIPISDKNIMDGMYNFFEYGSKFERFVNPIDEVFLPIFIGHNEIPQLSWGHAKYAHYFNDKSFNFFKFKHADHLPVIEEVDSPES